MSRNNAVDFALIERQKENIEPSKGGRSAMALKQLFTAEPRRLKEQQTLERAQFEQNLRDTEELDDPIEPYLEYLQWISNNYPSGRSVDSGLIQVLEKCTSQFRDVAYYKNDPRYLKVWLSYAKYSENPRDIFTYLARKEIGKLLATYYEEYANYLETNGRNIQADRVYQEGLKQQARPLRRLQKRFDEFKIRLESRNILPNEPQSPVFPARSALAVKSGTSLFASSHDEAKRPKRKLEVFGDDDEEDKSYVKTGGWDNLGSALFRNKENRFEAKSWIDETLPQHLSPKLKKGKISVFKDKSSSPSGPVFKIIEVPGKKTEKVDVNFDLLYQDEEFSVHEVLAMMKGVYRQNLQQDPVSPVFRSLVTQIRKTQFDETIHLDTQDLKKRSSPTATIYTKEAKQEIEAMFDQKDVGSVKRGDDGIVELVYDDFTENITLQPVDELTEKVHEETRIKRHELHEVVELIRKECIVNPADETLKEMLLHDLTPSLNTYKGFYRSDRVMNMCSTLKKSLNLKQSRHVFIEFDGTRDPFNLKCLLGEGGFASVYLAETMNGAFKAIKCQKPSSAWEFYILRQIEERLSKTLTLESIVYQNEIHVYKDESYLILEYIRKGTVLDVVNYYKTAGRKLEESLVVFYTCEILKVLNSLHSVGIMHGDLKPDNCMLRFGSVSESRDWKDAGIKLIDFGRSIDMTLFPKNVQFRSNWKTDNQDCPEMQNKETWTYQADYYGAAGIIHTMLFGHFIETRFDGEKNVLVNPIKRYWQQDIWNPLFDIMLNSKRHGELPLSNEMQKYIELMEKWLHENASGLDSILKDIEHGLK
jgi:checkpoint serine/threonine-protein kinase